MLIGIFFCEKKTFDNNNLTAKRYIKKTGSYSM